MKKPRKTTAAASVDASTITATVTTTREALLAALVIPAKIVPKTSPMDIYLRVELSSREGEVRVNVNNGMMCADVHVAAESTSDFALLVLGATLFDVARRTEGEVEIEVHGTHKVVVRSAGSSWTLPATDADNFPPALKVEAVTPIAINAAALMWLLGGVQHAAHRALDSDRAHLHTVLLETEKAALRAVATDGHRVAIADALEWGTGELHVVLPASSVAVLVATLPTTGELRVRAGARALGIDAGPASVVVLCADDHFPPYKKVIPAKNPSHVRVPADDFAAALRRTVVDRGGPIEMHFGEEHVTLMWSETDGRIGSGVFDAPCVGKVGMTMRAELSYLLDAFGFASGLGATVSFEHDGERDPLVLRAWDDTRSVTAVVMPQRRGP